MRKRVLRKVWREQRMKIGSELRVGWPERRLQIEARGLLAMLCIPPSLELFCINYRLANYYLLETAQTVEPRRAIIASLRTSTYVIALFQSNFVMSSITSCTSVASTLKRSYRASSFNTYRAFFIQNIQIFFYSYKTSRSLQKIYRIFCCVIE